MFGTSGIRGIYGKEITESLAERISAVFSTDRLVIGRDLRKSGVSLFESVSSGAMSVGADPIDLGIVPTPTVALATKKHSCRGIMITASHNPLQYNGLKLIEGGKEIGKDMEKEVVRKYQSEWKPRGVNGRGMHRDLDIIEDHKEMASRLADTDAISRRKPKVVVDCNGAGAVIIPYLLSDIGCSVISVNASLECFNRPSEPSRENVIYLGEVVRRSNADFAIAHDGDCDRCVIMDEKGEVLPLDVQLAMMIEHELRRSSNKMIVSTVEASLVIREVVEEAGGTIDITPVGSTFVGDMLEEKGALFGGEPCGEYIYEKGVHVPDAVAAAVKFCELFSRDGSFSKLKTKYRQNFIAREKYQTKDKKVAMDRIGGAISDMVEGKERRDDGIRIDEDDGWFLIRASGTEPIIRLTMEYVKKEKLEKRKKQVDALIRKCL